MKEVQGFPPWLILECWLRIDWYPEPLPGGRVVENLKHRYATDDPRSLYANAADREDPFEGRPENERLEWEERVAWDRRYVWRLFLNEGSRTSVRFQGRSLPDGVRRTPATQTKRRRKPWPPGARAAPR